MLENNLQSEMSVLTTIPEKSLEKLIKISCLCICDDTYTAIQNNENEVIINIGIGKLYIQIEKDYINYKFVPSKNLEDQLVSTIVDEKSPLNQSLDLSVVKKITNLYKDFF